MARPSPTPDPLDTLRTLIRRNTKALAHVTAARTRLEHAARRLKQVGAEARRAGCLQQPDPAPREYGANPGR